MFETNQKNQENGFRSGVASSETAHALSVQLILVLLGSAEPNTASQDKIIIPDQISNLRLEFNRDS